MTPDVRKQAWHMVRAAYSEFVPFLRRAMALLGHSVSEVQEDIAKYIAYGPHNLMVQAQRGQAKTSIAAAFCVWCLIQNPKFRVLVVSAGGSQASDIAILIIRLIMNMDELEFLRPDRSAGDRSSSEAFDVHHSLKGTDKSPSIKCLGITANLPGNRADLLLADDVESGKNSGTATQRAQLAHMTLEFSAICTTGRIIWLGTPQTMDSIYNAMPARGVAVRIWPGRYPTAVQLKNYGDALAPMLVQRMTENPDLQTGGGILGDQGRPIEKEGTGWLDEANQQQKERDQGTSYYQLQYMLNTRLVDALRYPLKPHRCIVLREFGTNLPLMVERGMTAAQEVPHVVGGFAFKLTAPQAVSQELSPCSGLVAVIDPAGGGVNADETGYAIGVGHQGSIYVHEVGGVPGGYETETLVDLAERIAKHKPRAIVIEKNFGYGAFMVVFRPIMLKALPGVAMLEDYVTGQKEARIIGTLEPIIGRGSLIFSENVVVQDQLDCQRYAPKDQRTYSLFFQMDKISRERRALVHDDRLDALEGLCRHFQVQLQKDAEKDLSAQRWEAHQKMLRQHALVPGARPKGPNMFNRYNR